MVCIFSFMAVFLESMLTDWASMACWTDWSLGLRMLFGFMHIIELVDLVDDANFVSAGVKIK